MAEQRSRTLNHFALFSFTDSYWRLSPDERRGFHRRWLAGLNGAAEAVHPYQIYPASAGSDILLWSATRAAEPRATSAFFASYARAANSFRALARPTEVLWGYTRPSPYTRTPSARELDPLSESRKQYLIVYPFTKTAGWYLMSRDARQGMMNEHIRVGKQYPEVGQMLLYSFGLQDQEFVVVYETDDLPLFSELVYELRSTEARRSTQRDTPVRTGIYHPAGETLALL